MGSDQLNVDSDELLRAAIELDTLADGLEVTLAQEKPNLSVDPAGRDEVSVAAATTLSAVAETFVGGASVGVHELRKIAAVLRAQAVGYRGAEETIEEAFRL
ncbi:PE family protein [Williamsia sp. 1135]|uniref:PE family protein n=1 Tax=Williamsia sp. 1135 TaxID=1889262 RepID=UPI000A0FE033|nr:PE family protein [Williamsia sp. 1135]ORM25085.1 hypothetical protein BFL43_25400 [Williamsia sp. 1135]